MSSRNQSDNRSGKHLPSKEIEALLPCHPICTNSGIPCTIEKIESEQLKKDVPAFCVGDTVKVHTRVIEERIQDEHEFSELTGCGCRELLYTGLHRASILN